MQAGQNHGDKIVVMEWLRKVHKATEIMTMNFSLADGTVLTTCENSCQEIQLYRCVEHIAHILQLPILYHMNVTGSMEIMIEFEGVKYFEYISKERLNNGK